MIYAEKEISGELSNFVKCFWMSGSGETEGIHTVLPDGYFDLIYRFSGEQLESVFLTGTWTKPVDVNYTKHVRFFGIRFKLIASEYIFHESIEKILDTSTELPFDYWNVDREVFGSMESFSATMSPLIASCLPDYSEVDRRKFRLIQILYDQKGDVEVSKLAEQIGWSSRQINRWFNRQFGLSLKTFANILKCHAAYQHIANGEPGAAKAYYDQAHFIKEIKRYTGATPKELHKNKNVRYLQLSTQSKS
ncbi:MAG TPA: AraC family transcriptional regulator [Prolixibacteraceae bacterium]|nr:AraC family transcriptional regulator [Prolixibacteraceae bacterium]